MIVDTVIVVDGVAVLDVAFMVTTTTDGMPEIIVDVTDVVVVLLGIVVAVLVQLVVVVEFVVLVLVLVDVMLELLT